MATVHFDISVAMAEHYDNCGCGCSTLLINCMFIVLNLCEFVFFFFFTASFATVEIHIMI